MASEQASESQEDFTRLSDATYDASQSQDIDTSAIQRLIEQHKQTLKTRRIQRKDAIDKAHEKRVDQVNRDTAKAKAKHEETIRAIRGPKMQKLLDLMQKKREVQQKIDANISQAEDATLSTAHKLQIAVDSRKAFADYDPLLPL